MKIVECTYENCDELIDFIRKMFKNWLDKSSMSTRNTCCPKRTENELLDKIKDPEKNTFYYAVDDKGVSGFLCTEEDSESESLYISYINVLPECRRKNIFRLMLEYVEMIAMKKHYKFLRLDTWTGNDTALKAFKSQGFIVEHSCSCKVKLYKSL